MFSVLYKPVKELQRECHKIVISYVDIGVEHIHIKNIQ